MISLAGWWLSDLEVLQLFTRNGVGPSKCQQQVPPLLAWMTACMDASDPCGTLQAGLQGKAQRCYGNTAPPLQLLTVPVHALFSDLQQLTMALLQRHAF